MRLFIINDSEELGRSTDGGRDLITISVPRVIRHAHVVRLQHGEAVAIQSGGVRYVGIVDSVSKKQLIVNIDEIQEIVETPAGRHIAMAVALPNTGAKLDMIVEKLTEVGVSQILFFSAERSQMRALDQKKLEKLSMRAIEASEQSNRWTVPDVHYLRSLDDVLVREGEKVLFEKGSGALQQSLPSSGVMLGLIGPEGGRSEKELHHMQDFLSVGLGESILRMETAAIVGGWMLVHGTCI